MASYGQYPAPQPRPRSNVLPWLLFFAALGFLIYRLWPHFGPLHDPNEPLRAVTPRGDLAEDEKATIAIYKQARDSVVYITTFQRNAYSRDINKMPAGTGSGFMWDDRGHIVTNAHVIRDADAAQVTRKEVLLQLATGMAGAGDLAAAVDVGHELANLDFGYGDIGRLLDEWQTKLQET